MPILINISFSGVSESTVRRIVSEGFENSGIFRTPGKHRSGRPKKEMDDFTLCALRQKVHFFYAVQKEVPTLRKLRNVIKSELDFECSLEHLRKILRALGFSFKKCQTNRSALIEKSNIAYKTEFYLDLLKKKQRFANRTPKKYYIY